MSFDRTSLMFSSGARLASLTVFSIFFATETIATVKPHSGAVGVEPTPTELRVQVIDPGPPPAPLASGCSDFDGDGYSPDGGACGPVDCNDGSRFIYPGAPELCDGIDNNCDNIADNLLLDSFGNEYCLSVRMDPPVVGQDMTVWIEAYHEKGISFLGFSGAGISGGGKTHQCLGNPLRCSYSDLFKAKAQPGEYAISATLFSNNAGNITAPFMVTVACDGEYCAPDSTYVKFIDWMRQKGYPECMVDLYGQYYFDSQARQNVISLAYRHLRGSMFGLSSSLPNPLVINLYDIVPTDSEATFLSIGAGEGGDCLGPAPNGFCPEPVPADYLFLERHFATTFGVDVNFVYHRMEIDYSDVIGTPTLVTFGSYTFYQFPSRTNFLSQFENGSIVHYAIETWDSLYIGDMTGAGKVAEVSFEPFNILGAVTYTHEWGHVFGMTHSFYGYPPTFIGLDGVMSNTYGNIFGTIVDPLDPLERYALEPINGYNDDATYVQTYTAAAMGTAVFPECLSIDPAITDGRIINETVDSVTYELDLTNLGETNAYFIRLSLFDGNFNNPPVAVRIIDRLEVGMITRHPITIAKQDLTNESIIFALDFDDLIQESRELNNYWSNTGLCCFGPTGNVNGDMSDNVDISDLTQLIDHLFINFTPLACSEEGNVDGDPANIVDIADLTFLIDHLFINFPPTAACQP